MLRPSLRLVSVIIHTFRTCSVVLLLHGASTKMLFLSCHSHKTLLRLYGIDSTDIPLYCSGLLGSFMALLGRGTIVANFHAVGICKLFAIVQNKEVRSCTQISFFRTSHGIPSGPDAFPVLWIWIS